MGVPQKVNIALAWKYVDWLQATLHYFKVLVHSSSPLPPCMRNYILISWTCSEHNVEIEKSDIFRGLKTLNI